MDYQAFLQKKTIIFQAAGFEIDRNDINASLFPFQKDLVQWSLRKGKCAIFADTGMGKTLQQCEWAHRVVQHTGGRVLIAAPLCVSQQTVEEAAK
jgi:CRISPR/Cas system-associated endonuclease/helicase Cas3